MEIDNYEKWMGFAFEEARVALRSNEVPIGAVFVLHDALSDGSVDFSKGQIVSRGYNRTNIDRNATKHAELNALMEIVATKPELLDDPRLVLYVTVEPCVMCCHAMLLAKIKTAVFGASNPRFGGCGSVLAVHRELGTLNCIKDVMGKEAIAILQEFYEQENPSAPESKRKKKS